MNKGHQNSQNKKRKPEHYSNKRASYAYHMCHLWWWWWNV